MDGVNWQNVDLFRYQKDIKATVIESLAKRCGGFLKSLSLRGCENLHESCLRTFTAKCPNIEELSLQRCKRVTDLTCGYLGMNCSKLRRLDLENCSAITDKALMSLSECKRLEYLNIGWCEEIQDAGVRSIILHSPLLETLICRGCDALSEHVFMDMKEHMRELRHLNLMRCYVHDDTVADIANSCSHLEYLCLSMCAEITDRALISLGNGCPELRDLDLSGCVELTDHGFVALAKSCHQLERLDLADCSLITDTTLENFSKGCSRLKNLSLSHCELITDAGLRQFCLSPNLKDVLFVLELDNCPQITDASLDYIKQMRSLQRVDLYDCQNITKDAIKRFKACNPDVEVHAYFAPATPPVSAQPIRNRIFRCCSIL